MINEILYNDILIKANKELERILREEKEISVLKEYGIYNIYFDKTRRINESLSPESIKELEELKRVLGNLGHIAARLIMKLVKFGAKQAVLLTIKAAKGMYRLGKDNKEIGKYIVLSLTFLMIGYFGNQFLDRYNEKPLVSGTHIEQKTVSGQDSLVVYDDNSDEIAVVQQPEADEAPVIKKAKQKSQVKTVEQSITLLKPGERTPEEYTISDEMFKALAEVEHFVPRIYDTANPSKKVTLKQLRSGKGDITCCFGHKLTPQERRTWSPNRKFTHAEGMKMYKKDLQHHIDICNNKLKTLPYYNKVRFSQGFFDTMVSMEFNMGAGSMFGNATRPVSAFWQRLLALRIDTKNNCINKNDLDYALARINTQNTGGKNMGGLKYRRRAEYLIACQTGNKVNPELYHLKAPNEED